MGRIEQRMQLFDLPMKVSLPVNAPEREHLLTLAEQLLTPELSFETRLEIASQIRILLKAQEEWIPPPVLSNLDIS